MNPSTSQPVSPDSQARPSKRRVMRRPLGRRIFTKRFVSVYPDWKARMMIRRLNYAFTDLWHQGIIGGPEIYSDGAGCLIHMMERADVEAEAGREIIGICFYNDVASENLDETGTLQLDWYPYESSWDFGYEIASKIQAALENRGLMTRWEGHEKMTAQECIEPNKIEIYGLKKPWDNPWDAYWPPCD